jgi:hypothetical protein
VWLIVLWVDNVVVVVRLVVVCVVCASRTICVADCLWDEGVAIIVRLVVICGVCVCASGTIYFVCCELANKHCSANGPLG